MRNQQGQIVKTVKVDKPVEVLHNCVHTDTFKKIAQGEIEETVDDALLVVKEKFNFLFVGHWLNGDFGHDRKNIAMLIRVFCETFKNTVTAKRPGLILKTSGAGFSILDRERLLKKIRDIRVASGPNAPNVYLLHGDLSEKEMNSLFNHPKIKVHVNLTHGEGFGRPLLEASMSEKPIIASGWSGHLDFLNKDDAVLVGGELQNVHPSAVWQDVILAESQWFMPDPNQAASAMAFIFEKYSEWLPKSKKLAATNKEQFSYKKIFERTKELVEKYVPEFAIQAPLKLPSLKKLGEKSKPELNAQPIKLPTLKKLGEPVKVE
jgi:glycosyltransferase involved in cell wall biosynthesis